MQLKRKLSIKGALSAATSTLLASHPAMGQAAESTDKDWAVDTALLYYAEQNRVSVAEAVMTAKKEIGDDEFISLRVVLDSLTGASPNGAIPTNTVQTFTSPSGEETYTAQPGETPLDSSFMDARVALSAEWEKPFSRTFRGVFGTNISSEHDYASLGLSGNLSWDFNNRNTTFTLGGAVSADTIKPEGGIPVPLSPMSASKATVGAEDNKTVSELLLGLTQVINRKTLMQFNYTMAQENGYLTEPYKILSVTDGVGNLRAVDPYLYESRPETRTRNALFWKTVHQFDEDVLHGSYRYYWDDWGVTSHTVDLAYRHETGNGHYWQPHFRYYIQDKADFYYYNLVDGSIPQYATADYRLADMSTTTIGLKYGVEYKPNHEFSVRAESMTQQSEGDAPFPDNNAYLVQFNYMFLF